jgi:hypothetical protein
MAAAGTTLTTINWAAFLKELYPDGLPEQILMRNHLFLERVKKDGEAYGVDIVIPVTVTNPSGRSAAIATLLGATNSPVSPTTSRAFRVQLASDYAATYIDELTMRKAANDRGAFVNARQFEIDGILRELGNSMAHALYRAGDGTIARGDGAYSIAGNVITVLNRPDTKFANIGMVLDFVPNSSGAPSGAARAVATQRAVITSIDEDAGTLTCALDVTGAALTAFSTNYTSAANTDWIAPVGDYNPNFTTVNDGAGKIHGLAAWIPLVAPVLGSDSFWGVDRGIHKTRLAGNRLNDPTAPAEDSIMALAEVMKDRGARPDIVLVSARQFTKISKRMQAKVELDTAGGDATYGFMRFYVATSAGILPVYADSDCPEDRGYILTMRTWAIKHLGLAEITRGDGLSALRRPGQDAIEIRAVYYAQLICTAPGENGVFAVS